MKLSATVLRRLHWLNLPGALLLALLQRTPVLRVAATAGDLIHAAPVGHVLRSALATVASLGTLHTLAGATTLSVSSGAVTGVTGAVGSQLGPIALGTLGTLGQPLSWQISGVIPAGLAFQNSSGTRLTTSGTLNTPGGVMLLSGTPTAAAGTYPLTLTAYQGNNRTLSYSPAFTYNIVLTGGPAALPAFTTQPASLTVNAGSTATFTVAATGSPTFQWRKDGAPLTGATAATFTLSAVTPANAGAYSVVATNAAGTATSTNATLAVNSAPAAVVITTQPVSQFSVVGQSVTFTVVASGNPAPSYQWLKNSAPLAGAVNASLTLGNLTLADAGNYTVNLTTSFGTVTSAAATLNVAAAAVAPALTTQLPGALNLLVGQPLVLNVGAIGSALSYQWRRVNASGTVSLPGATASSLTLKPLTAADAGVYFCVVTNPAGSVDSAGCIVTVAAASTNPGRLLNLSVLTGLAPAGDSFSLGYVVAGATAANPKPLVIRAAGPALGALGVPDTLVDPFVASADDDQSLASGQFRRCPVGQAPPLGGGHHDRRSGVERLDGKRMMWGGFAPIVDAMAAVGAFAYAAPASRDAAILAAVTGRDNSVKISAGASAPSGTGAVIGEVYDATTTAAFNAATTPRLINVSVRKHVGTVLTMGFVIGGATAKTMLVRAIGPTLGVFGVPDALSDPKIELFDQQGRSLAANDNWGGAATLATAFADTGAFALNAGSADAALLATLAPGNYTAQVTVATGVTGVALVEAYDVP